MTEVEWFTSNDVLEMYLFVEKQPGVVRRKAGRRKLRLFGVACCRSLGELMTDPRSLAAVEVAERLADQQATEEEVALARAKAWQAHDEGNEEITQEAARILHPRLGLFGGAGICWNGPHRGEPGYRAFQKRCRWQADVMRCVFGYLFGKHPLPPGWKKWSDGTLTRMAQAIYDERAFDRLPILADALEDAGCADAAILDHLRGPGPPVRGCWPLDLLLGKE
jgi:hypothetical protein